MSEERKPLGWDNVSTTYWTSGPLVITKHWNKRDSAWTFGLSLAFNGRQELGDEPTLDRATDLAQQFLGVLTSLNGSAK